MSYNEKHFVNIFKELNLSIDDIFKTRSITAEIMDLFMNYNKKTKRTQAPRELSLTTQIASSSFTERISLVKSRNGVLTAKAPAEIYREIGSSQISRFKNNGSDTQNLELNRMRIPEYHTSENEFKLSRIRLNGTLYNIQSIKSVLKKISTGVILREFNWNTEFLVNYNGTTSASESTYRNMDCMVSFEDYGDFILVFLRHHHVTSGLQIKPKLDAIVIDKLTHDIFKIGNKEKSIAECIERISKRGHDKIEKYLDVQNQVVQAEISQLIVW